MAGYIKQETLATELSDTPPGSLALAHAEVNGEQTAIAIEKVVVDS
jgi:hypothetical protein